MNAPQQPVILQVEDVPPHFARFHRYGGELGFRTRWFGVAIQFGWSWQPTSHYCVFGIDTPFGTQTYFNGPRLVQMRIVLATLRAKLGCDLMLFLGQRDPKIQAQIASARAQFEAAIAARVAAPSDGVVVIDQGNAPVVEQGEAPLVGEAGVMIE